MNGFPAALFEFDAPMGRRPPRLVTAMDLDADGRVAGLWVVANPQTLARVR